MKQRHLVVLVLFGMMIFLILASDLERDDFRSRCSRDFYKLSEQLEKNGMPKKQILSIERAFSDLEDNTVSYTEGGARHVTFSIFLMILVLFFWCYDIERALRLSSLNEELALDRKIGTLRTVMTVIFLALLIVLLYL